MKENIKQKTENRKQETRNAEYPFVGRYLDVGGVRMHYLDEGAKDAPAIVMVHGNPTWSFYFRRLVSAFCKTHRVVVPDHVGMGFSEKPGEDKYVYTLESRVRDLERLIEGLDLRGAITLVVHDWGGMIGMAYATRHPERIGRVVVLNTGGFLLPPGKRMPWQLKVARMPVLGAILVRGLNAFCRGAVKDCVVRGMDAETARGFVLPYDSWRNRLAVHRFIQDIPLRKGDRAYEMVAETERGLGKLRKVPMLICWGEKDFVFDGHFLARWREFFPEAQVHEFSDAGHYVLEDAHERVIPLMEKFFAEHPVGAGVETAGKV